VLGQVANYFTFEKLRVGKKSEFSGKKNRLMPGPLLPSGKSLKNVGPMIGAMSSTNPMEIKYSVTLADVRFED
jgi:hypothetical protein